MNEIEILTRIHESQLEHAAQLDGLGSATVALFIGTATSIGFLGSFLKPPLRSTVARTAASIWFVAAVGFGVALSLYVSTLFWSPYRWNVPSTASASVDIFTHELKEAIEINSVVNRDRVTTQQQSVGVLLLSLLLSALGTTFSTRYLPKAGPG